MCVPNTPPIDRPDGAWWLLLSTQGDESRPRTIRQKGWLEEAVERHRRLNPQPSVLQQLLLDVSEPSEPELVITPPAAVDVVPVVANGSLPAIAKAIQPNPHLGVGQGLPSWVWSILAVVTPRDHLDEVVGDLEEGASKYAIERGLGAARIWLSAQIFYSVIAFAWSAIEKVAALAKVFAK